MKFLATIDTTIYDVAYAANQEVDTADWNRAQLLQFLSNGLIYPAGGGTAVVGDIELDDLSDVSSPSPGAGYVLVFDPPVWVPAAPYELGLRLTDMSDVDLLSVPPVHGQTLVYDQPSGKWVPDSPLPGVSVLDELEDVDTATVPPADGQALVWDDADQVWVPGTVAGGGGSVDPADLSLRFVQPTAAGTWTINHTLGFRPNVSVVDTFGNLVIAEVLYNSDTQITLSFTPAMAGEAYLS
jgi:hypothetical protein